MGKGRTSPSPPIPLRCAQGIGNSAPDTLPLPGLRRRHAAYSLLEFPCFGLNIERLTVESIPYPHHPAWLWQTGSHTQTYARVYSFQLSSAPPNGRIPFHPRRAWHPQASYPGQAGQTPGYGRQPYCP